MRKYRVVVCVKEVKGKCAAGYKPGDTFTFEWFYIKPMQNTKICLHALNSMLTLLMPFIKGVSARELGIGTEDDIGYLQCPDPGKPYTRGGTVLFELKREEVD
ncbi:MAG: TIGR04076 family protein [Thermoprotei archaeon]|nr:MAG: TIGR04076 family protein [Thermoprotei archaeon]